MSDSGFSGNIGGLRGVVQYNGGRNGQAVRLISAPADLVNENQTQRVAGVIGNISAQGRVQIQTDDGDIIVQARDGLARQLQAGQNVVVEIPADNFDRQARIYLPDAPRQAPPNLENPDLPPPDLPRQDLPVEDVRAEILPPPDRPSLDRPPLDPPPSASSLRDQSNIADTAYRPDGRYSEARNIRDVLRIQQSDLPRAQDVVDQGRPIQLSALSEDVARSVIVPPRDIAQQISNIAAPFTAPPVSSPAASLAFVEGDIPPAILATPSFLPHVSVVEAGSTASPENQAILLSSLGVSGNNLPPILTQSRGASPLNITNNAAQITTLGQEGVFEQGQTIGRITLTQIGNAASALAQFAGLSAAPDNGQNQVDILSVNRPGGGFYQGLANAPSAAFSQIGQINGQIVAVTHDQRPVLQFTPSPQIVAGASPSQAGDANHHPARLFTAPIAFTNIAPNGAGYIPALGGTFAAHPAAQITAHQPINAASSTGLTAPQNILRGGGVSGGLLGQLAGQVSASLFGGTNAAGFGFAPISSEFFAFIQNGLTPSLPGQIIPGDLAPGGWSTLNDIQAALSSNGAAASSASSSAASSVIAGHQNPQANSGPQAGSQISQQNADIIAQSIQSTTAISMSSMGNILPSPLNPALLGAGLMFFMAAIRGGDAAQWLGSKNQDQLKRMGKGDLIDDLRREGAAINRLSQPHPTIGGDDELAAAAFHTLINDGNAPPSRSDMGDLAGWDVMIVPIDYQGQIDRVTIWSRQEEIAPDIKTQGQRFIFDMYLQKMGAVQIDGLCYGKNLDMILRSQHPLSASMQHVIQSSYHNVLSTSGQSGRVYFHVFKPEPA